MVSISSSSLSAMAFPSSCIRDIVGADRGTDVGADKEEEDIETINLSYEIVWYEIV